MIHLLAMGLAMAQDVPVPEGEVKGEPRRAFESSEYEALEQFRALYDERVEIKDAEIEALRTQLEKRAVEQGLVTAQQLAAASAGAPGAAGSASPTASGAGSAPSTAGSSTAGSSTPGSSTPLSSGAQQLLAGRPSATPRGTTRTAAAQPANSLGSALVFAVPEVVISSTTVVPAGSYMKVRILTGVEANARDDIPMLVQADHALVGPNRRRIDLTGCMVVLQVKGDLSTDRVVGKAMKLSCVRDDGEHVSRELNGYLAGEDSTFGVTGQLITRQGRVIAAASVASLAEAAGSAVAAAQETTQVLSSPLGGSAGEVTNVDGNPVAYIAGSSGSAAAGLIANWYLKYADQLLPAIAVGSGRDVWVVLLDSVEVPPLAVPGGER